MSERASGSVSKNHAVDMALAKLHRKLGSKVASSDELCAPYATDDTGIEGRVDAVVLAETTGDIQKAVQIAGETGCPIVPRAGGSGRTGGAVPILGGIVLCTKGLNSVVDFDRKEGTAVVGPGMVLDDLYSLVESEGWFYPPDPNSSGMCCVAGTVAENAAGPRAFHYGSTRDYVLGIETFLASGEHFFSGRRTKKGVTGYDTTALLVGSEGTLAAFGDVTLRLVPKPEKVMTLLGLFGDMEAASKAVEGVVSARLAPRAIEFLDELTLQIMRDHQNPIDQRAGALLLIEVEGDEDSCLWQAERVGHACDEAGALSVEVAQSESQRNKLWAARKQMSVAVRAHARHKISEDVVVPRTRLGELLQAVRRIGEENRILSLAYGHAGDGNLHVNFLWNQPAEKARVEVAIEALFRATMALGGTLSGEHGIGLLKAPYLALEQPPAQIELQQRLKAAFDPKGVMNPGKIFPRRGHGNC